MATDPAVAAAIGNYQRTVNIVHTRVEAYARRAWAALGGWDRADIDQLVEVIVPAVAAGQLQLAALTDAYLADIESIVFDTTIPPVGVPSEVVDEEAIRGVPAEEVYGRVGPTIWGRLGDGAPLAIAVAAGLTRLLVTADIDLQLAANHASRYVLGSKGDVTGYRRVIGGFRTCRLCASHAGTIYKTADLMPSHARCRCSTVPIWADKDPAGRYNDDLLEALAEEGTDLALELIEAERTATLNFERAERAFARSVAAANPGAIAAASTRRDRALDLLLRRRAERADLERGVDPDTVTVHDHDEYGPVLTDAAHNFSVH